ncbi:MAG TPA: 16S rRNA (adenine(1518)-N(6)/adenine(1519)-N(6))-dimethyltransferase RsmA [Acidimicrobiales bacterium]
MTLSRRQVRDLLDRHGVRPSRALGQNFVADPNTVRRIARLAEVGPGDRVVEVGAGLGSLTLALAETGADVVAIELDRHLLPALRSVVEPAGVRVVQADALRLDWDAILTPSGAPGLTSPAASGVGAAEGPGTTAPEVSRPWVLVGNLPYNIATPLVLDVLARAPAIGRMLVMVQREVGERLAARVGDEAYGIPSVKVAWWADAEVVGRVPPTVFIPEPRVESVLVRLRRHDRRPPRVDRERVFRLVEAGFGQRRKMLRRSLAGLAGTDDLARAAIRPEARAEELSLDDWVRLAVGVPR